MDSNPRRPHGQEQPRPSCDNDPTADLLQHFNSFNVRDNVVIGYEYDHFNSNSNVEMENEDYDDSWMNDSDTVEPSGANAVNTANGEHGMQVAQQCEAYHEETVSAALNVSYHMKSEHHLPLNDSLEEQRFGLGYQPGNHQGNGLSADMIHLQEVLRSINESDRMGTPDAQTIANRPRAVAVHHPINYNRSGITAISGTVNPVTDNIWDHTMDLDTRMFFLRRFGE